MYTPTYHKVTSSNVISQNAIWIPLNNQSPNAQIAIQVILTQNTGVASYTVYQTAFQATGIISGQPYPFDITNLKYWQIVGTSNSLTNQYLSVTLPASGLWVISNVTLDAIIEYSVLMRGMQ